MAATTKNTLWSFDEVQTLLHLVADEKIQRELDVATRNNAWTRQRRPASLEDATFLLTLCSLLESVVSLSIVKPTSNKETYFILTFMFDNPCFYGAPKS